MDYKTRDIIRIKNTEEVRSYAGRYTGTKAVVHKVDTDFTVTIETFDGKRYTFPKSYIEPYEQYEGADWLPPVPKITCSCGEKYAKISKGIHLDYCDLYKEKK